MRCATRHFSNFARKIKKNIPSQGTEHNLENIFHNGRARCAVSKEMKWFLRVYGGTTACGAVYTSHIYNRGGDSYLGRRATQIPSGLHVVDELIYVHMNHFKD